MKIIADLHMHSKYSRAVSPDMTLPFMGEWALKKGIKLLGTSDWTHPKWLSEIKSNLIEKNDGLYSLKKNSSEVLFLLTTEISSIYKEGGKLRRIHNLIFAPNIETAQKINAELVTRGCNLKSDGRPIIGLSARNLAELVFSISEKCLIVPAHIWTPWFSLYGSMSGFDSMEEAYGEFAKYIYGIETGLSSDPLMNWRIKELDSRSILSNSDSHSGAKLGREATIFELKNISFLGLRNAIINGTIDRTIEFYPEEGKYHYSGHRKCKIRQIVGGTCPVCGKPLTAGVMQRVEKLAGRSEEEALKYGTSKRPGFTKLVSLNKIIAESLGVGETSKKIAVIYEKLIKDFGNELNILMNVSVSEISKKSSEKIGEGILKVRKGDIVIEPGFDGEFGIVKIWGKKSTETLTSGQMSIL